MTDNGWQDLLDPETARPRDQLEEGGRRKYDVDSAESVRRYLEESSLTVIPGTNKITRRADRTYERQFTHVVGGLPASGNEVYALITEKGEFEMEDAGDSLPDKMEEAISYDPQEATLLFSTEEINIDSAANRAV